MLKRAGLLLAALMLAAQVQASPAGDALAEHLYAGTAWDGLTLAEAQCSEAQPDWCFGAGLFKLVLAYEGLASGFYRHGAVVPGQNPAALLLGLSTGDDPAPANPNPLPVSYTDLRMYLETFVLDLDNARGFFEQAAGEGDYVLPLDPYRVRIDFNGDGAADEGETLGALIAAATPYAVYVDPDASFSGGKTKSKAAPDTSVGFDRADAMWFAGYSQVVAAPVDLLLAHDFSGFFETYMHRVFPKAGLPMAEHGDSGELFMDPESDTGIADMIAAVHLLRFEVTNPPRLAGVLERLRAITSYSRQNWELILAETDDDRELVPSPKQTSIMPGMTVTEETVAAWLSTLDTVDQVLGGELLVPHWRFEQGFDLQLYFTTATETDLVLLLTGQGALQFLREGPIADAESFREANKAFGTDWLNYVFWFN